MRLLNTVLNGDIDLIWTKHYHALSIMSMPIKIKVLGKSFFLKTQYWGECDGFNI